MPLETEQFYPVAVFLLSFSATFVATPKIAGIMKSLKITGVDVHKTRKTRIPEMCGLAILVGLLSGALAYGLLSPSSVRLIAAFTGTVTIAGIIGIVDDLRPLNPRLKPVLTAVACVPILLLGTYNPFPVIPLIGPVRLTVVYLFLIPLAIAVTSNSVNMMDVMNGAMPGTAAVIAATVGVILVIAGNIPVATLSITLLGALLAFYYYNRYPAKVFGGDTGSLSVGAALGALSILGSLETVVMVALIPQIMNAFYGLASVGRLYERREISQRPTRLLRNGKIAASTAKNAPVTLTRLILAKGPLIEPEIVKGMILLTLASSGLAVITFWITVTVGKV